jgi:HTH-type transcriptional regulator/antitoxin HigA
MPMAAEVFPVGVHLADELDARGWTQADFAEVLGRPTQWVSQIILGKEALTRESAAQIAAALGTGGEFWLKLQDSYLSWKQPQD